MKKIVGIIVMVVCLGFVSVGFAEDSLSKKQLEGRLQELQNLLPQLEQAYITTQGRIAEIKNLLEEIDKVKEKEEKK